MAIATKHEVFQTNWFGWIQKVC